MSDGDASLIVKMDVDITWVSEILRGQIARLEKRIGTLKLPRAESWGEVPSDIQQFGADGLELL